MPLLTKVLPSGCRGHWAWKAGSASRREMRVGE